ncbi:MAG: HIT domain-containing protein [Pirellulales bacterium]
MSYEQLWAPWRLGYIVGSAPKDATPKRDLSWLEGADHECFLCRSAADLEGSRTLTPWHGLHAIVVLNRYPYANGHLLVAPRNHKARLDDVSTEEHLQMMQTITRVTGVLERLMNCEGFNIGLNVGKVAGAGVPGHLHWHVVPRWSGDTNFMPVLASTSVIPQSLEALFAMLQEELA